MTSSHLIQERTRLLARLDRGTPRGRLAARVFRDLLEGFPALAGPPFPVGTIPLDVDIDGSDLDIIVEIGALGDAWDALRDAFGESRDFRMHVREADRAIVCAFVREELPVEIFGRAEPVEQQNAYRHMIAEGRLLDMAGPEARREIRRLKEAGLKTEPAFGRYFGLTHGDPYEILYRLYDASEDELRRITERVDYGRSYSP